MEPLPLSYRDPRSLDYVAPYASPDVLLVGEAPNQSGAGRRADTIFMHGRLARLHGQTRALPRTNLLKRWPGAQGKGSAFPLALARPAAARLWRRTPLRTGLLIVGSRAASAFGLRRSDYEYLEWFEHRRRRVAVCPHPSGIVLWWNDAANVERARQFFRELFEPEHAVTASPAGGEGGGAA